VWIDDETWDRMKDQALRSRRTVAGEVRCAVEVYLALAEADDPAIKEILDGVLE
jgi:hypothetical protein